MPRWKFYLRYSWEWFKAQRGYALSAALCVATSVAIIVMIESVNTVGRYAILENIKQINGGDISIWPLSRPLQVAQLDYVQSLCKQGQIEAFTTVLWGQVSAISRVSGRTAVVVVRGIDPESYPLYGRVVSVVPAGEDLNSLLQDPEDIVLSQGVFDRLALEIGDALELRASSGEILEGRVRGVVRPDSESAEDMQVFGYAFVGLAQAQSLLTHKKGQVDRIYLRLPAETDRESIAASLVQAFPHAQVKTFEDVWKERQNTLETWTRTLSVIGILAILIGSLGIIDTTIVSVRRKSTEMAILKALGATPRQVRDIVLSEAALIGGIGSLLGVLLGTGGSLVLAGLLSQVLAVSVQWQPHPGPTILGPALGIGLSVVFAYLPAQYAVRLSPNLILQQASRGSGSQLKPWSLKHLLVVATVGGAIASVLMRSTLGFFLAYAAVLEMVGLSWIVGRTILLIRRPPGSWGGYTLRIALQHLRSQSQRVTLVLVSLILSVSVMGIVLFLGSNVKQAFRKSMHRDLDYTFIVIAPGDRREETAAELENRQGIEDIVPVRVERVTPLRVNSRDLAQTLDAALQNPDVASLVTDMAIRGIPLESGWGEQDIVEGQGLTQANGDDQRTVTILQPVAEALQVEVGDTIELAVRGQVEPYKVVGLKKKPLFVMGEFETSIVNLEDHASATAVFYVQTALDDVAQVAQQVRRELPEVIVLEAGDLLSGMDRLISQQIWFLSVVATLVMLVGMLIIANGVALAMFEERRVWAVMKAVGAGRSHLLKIILWEYGFIGLAGGIAGLLLATGSSSLVVRLLFRMTAEFSLHEMAMLTTSTVAASLIAAWMAARRAITEPPLPVLRSE